MKVQIENKNANHKRKKFEPVRDRDGDIKIINNGRIEFCYSEARDRLGLSTATFALALDELIDHGFIDITQSGFGVQRIKTLYSISKRWRLYGTAEFVNAQRKTKRPRKPKTGNFIHKKTNE